MPNNKWQPAPVFLPRGFHGRRSLVGCSPWNRKESDTTKQLSAHVPANNKIYHKFFFLKSQTTVLQINRKPVNLQALLFLQAGLFTPTPQPHMLISNINIELCIQMGISFLFSFAFRFSSFLSYL